MTDHVKGELQRASEKYEARKEAIAIDHTERAPEALMRLLISDLGLDYEEMLRSRGPVIAGLAEGLASGLPVPELVHGFWIDGVIVGILLERARNES